MIRMAASLSPDPVPAPLHLPRATMQALAVVGGAALILARQSGLPAVRSVWAEDGMFLVQALGPDQLAVWVQPYRGYLNATPRLLASLISTLPLEWAAVALAGGAALVASATALYVFRAAAGVIESTPIRLWVALLPLILPVVGFETMNNLSNLQFFLLYAAVWALLARPIRAADRWAGLVVVLAATLATPLSLLLAPVVAVRLATVGPRRDDLVTLAWFAGIIAQATVIVSAGGASYTTTGPAYWLPDLYALRVLLSAALGVRLADGAWAVLGQGSALAAGLVAIGFVGYVATRPLMRSRGSVGLLLVLSTVFFAVGVGLRWSPEILPSPTSLGLAAARLMVVPILLLFAAVAFVLDSPDPRWQGAARWRSVVLLTIGTSLFVCGIDYFSVGNRRDVGPDWVVELDAARARCASSGASSTLIPISPPGWTVLLDCPRVVRGG